MHQLILASQSPRRSELLREMGLEFTVDIVKVSEIIDENLNLDDAIVAVAQTKAEAVATLPKYSNSKGVLILSADTVVVLGNRVLGKPIDAAQAKEFLSLLSGNEHRVITGVCVYELDKRRAWTDSDTTWIRFRNLSEKDIQNYIATQEPFDKAGGYAIQGGAKDFVAERRGSWSNVVGLPVEKLESMIASHGWKINRRK